MKNPRSLLFLLFAFALGCGGATSSGGGAEGPSASSKVHTMRLEAQGKVVTVDESGKIMAEGRMAGELRPGGEYYDPNGKLAATLQDDGHIYIEQQGKTIPDLVVTSDGRLTAGGQTLSINDDGTLSGADDLDGITIEVDPEGRRTAMFLIALLIIAGS